MAEKFVGLMSIVLTILYVSNGDAFAASLWFLTAILANVLIFVGEE